MLFLITCEDAPNSVEPRTRALKDHLRYIEATLDRIRVAGPVRDAAGENIASAYIVEAESQAAADRFLQDDPYYQAGVWASTSIRPFVGVAGEWVGGKTW